MNVQVTLEIEIVEGSILDLKTRCNRFCTHCFQDSICICLFLACFSPVSETWGSISFFVINYCVKNKCSYPSPALAVSLMCLCNPGQVHYIEEFFVCAILLLTGISCCWCQTKQPYPCDCVLEVAKAGSTFRKLHYAPNHQHQCTRSTCGVGLFIYKKSN